jgi:hypothetical protein
LSKEEFDNMINDPEKMREYAEELHDRFKGGQFKEKSDLRRRAKNWIESRENPIAAPRGDKERDFQQNTAEEAQKILKKRGLDISIADIQAALWFHEKELFGKYGVATERSKPADYEDAAKNTVNMIQGGDLFKNKTKEKKPKKGAAPPPPEEPQHDAFGGSIRGAYKSGGHVSGGFMPHHIPGVHIVTADAGEPIFSGRK